MLELSSRLTNLAEVDGAVEKFVHKTNKYVLRGGAQAMAQLFYDEARANAPVGNKGHWFYGTHQKYFFPAGTLKAAIYQVFSKDRSTGYRFAYQVSWNHQKAPYGFMVEYGTSRAPASPFMRPAYAAMRGQVIAEAQQRMRKLMSAGRGELL